MARVSLEELRRRSPGVDQVRLDATTEDAIDAQAEADDEDMARDYEGRPVLPPRDVRLHLHMTQTEFAEALFVPVGTVRNWEQGRTLPDPAARSLLNAVCRDPHAVLTALNPGRSEAWDALRQRIRDDERQRLTGRFEGDEVRFAG